MKPRRQQRDWLQEYRNRDYVLSEIDDAVFDALNEGDYTLSCMTTGCIDALEFIPGGALRATTAQHYDQFVTYRGMSAEELLKLDQWIVSLDEE